MKIVVQEPGKAPEVCEIDKPWRVGSDCLHDNMAFR